MFSRLLSVILASAAKESPLSKEASVYFLHHHSSVSHDGRAVITQLECGGFRDHVDEAGRLDRLAQAYQGLMADKPDEVGVHGNLHDGYTFVAESSCPDGHPLRIEVTLFIDQERCDESTLAPEPAETSAPMELVFSQIADIVNGV